MKPKYLTLLILILFLVLPLIFFPTATKGDEIPDDTWSDLLTFYSNITVEYQDLRVVQNNKSSNIDVRAVFDSASNPERIAIYQLLGNGTLMVEIVDGSVTQSEGTYTNLAPNAKLALTVKAKPAVASGSAQVQTKIQLIEKEEVTPSGASPVSFELSIVRVPSYVVTFQKEFSATVSIKNKNSMSQSAVLAWYVIDDDNGEEISQGTKTVMLGPGEQKECSLEISRPPELGEYTFRIRLLKPRGATVSGVTDKSFDVIGFGAWLFGPAIWIVLVIVFVAAIVIYLSLRHLYIV